MIKPDGHGVARKLRQGCLRRLADIRIPMGSDIAEICALVGQLRGRPIYLIPMAMQATHPCGYWISTGTADFIVYDTNTRKTHQEHIIAHELAHIICCHRGAAQLDDESAQTLFPDLDPALVRDMLRRSAYSDAQEQEAEVMATIILQRATRHRRRAGAGISEDVAARIEQSLTYGRSRVVA
jgi:hypothetical protein